MNKTETTKGKGGCLSAALVLLILAVSALVLLPLLWILPQRQSADTEAAAAAETLCETVTPAPQADEAPPPSVIPVYDPYMTGDEGWVTANGKLYYLQGGGPVTGLRLIDGKYCFFDEHGIKAEAVGVDVSTYNEEIDWESVRAQGIEFAIIRVGGRGWTSGNIYGDLRCEAYLHGAQRAGLRIGVYFYSTAVNEAEAAAEAEEVLRVLNGRPLALPVYCDTERSGEFPDGRADGLSAAERTRVVQSFCRRIENAGYRAGVYSGRYFFMSSLDLEALSRYELWMASYTSDGMPPFFGRSYRIWQFTDRGNVDGIRCGADMNVMF